MSIKKVPQREHIEELLRDAGDPDMAGVDETLDAIHDVVRDTPEQEANETREIARAFLLEWFEQKQTVDALFYFTAQLMNVCANILQLMAQWDSEEQPGADEL